MTICTVADCDGRAHARGWCIRHYNRWLRLGSVELTPRPTREQAFWAKVQKTDTCWLWTGAKVRGYGSFSSGGAQNGAHRFAYELLVGPIPEGLQIDHLCRNRGCVNPEHLEAVTQYVNIMRSDAVSAVNARRTHCLRGHPFSPENTYNHINGSRVCKTCHKIWRERAKARRRQREAEDLLRSTQ